MSNEEFISDLLGRSICSIALCDEMSIVGPHDYILGTFIFNKVNGSIRLLPSANFLCHLLSTPTTPRKVLPLSLPHRQEN